MFVKPGNDPVSGEQFRVRIPGTFALMNPKGEEVPDDPFWRWMLRHKDVVETDRPPPVTEVEQPEGASTAAEPEHPAIEQKAAEPTDHEPQPEQHAEAAQQAPVPEH